MSAETSSSPSNSTATEIPPVPTGHSQLYLKNLSFATTEDSLAAHVQSITGSKPHSTNIVTTKRPGKFQGRSRGFGFVTVVTSAANNLINKLNNVEFEGRVISVVEAKPRDPNAPRPERKPRQPRPPRNNDNNNNNNNDSKSESSSSNSEPRAKPERKTFENASQLYVNNLSFETTQEELAALFQSKTGQAPLDVEIVKSRFGKYKNRSRGFGFVFVSNAVVDKALSLDTTVVNERAIGVQHAKPQDENQERPRRPRKPRRQSNQNSDNNNNNNNGNNNDAPDSRRRRAPKSEGDDNQNQNQNQNDNNNAPRRGGRGRGRGRGGRGGRGRGGNTNNGDNQQQQ